MIRYLALAVLVSAALSCTQSDSTRTSGEKREMPLAKPETPRDRLGLPEYPGADEKGNASAKDANGDERNNAQYETTDPPAKVAEFYQKSLGFKPNTKGNVTQLVGRTPVGADVLIFIEPDGGSTKIRVKGIRYAAKPGK